MSKPKTPYREGTRFSFEDLDFFACCGFIRVIDNRDKIGARGRQQDIAPTEFLERATALHEETQAKKVGRLPYKEKLKLVRMAQAVEIACEQAVEMGDPFDPQVQAYHRLHKTYRSQMVLGGYSPQRMQVTDHGLIIPELSL